jgi:hypothetical protein
MRFKFNTSDIEDAYGDDLAKRVLLHPSELDVERVFDLGLDVVELLDEHGDVWIADVLDVETDRAWGGAFVWVELR